MKGDVEYRLVKLLAMGGDLLHAVLVVKVPQTNTTVVTWKGRGQVNKFGKVLKRMMHILPLNMYNPLGSQSTEVTSSK